MHKTDLAGVRYCLQSLVSRYFRDHLVGWTLASLDIHDDSWTRIKLFGCRIEINYQRPVFDQGNPRRHEIDVQFNKANADERDVMEQCFSAVVNWTELYFQMNPEMRPYSRVTVEDLERYLGGFYELQPFRKGADQKSKNRPKNDFQRQPESVTSVSKPLPKRRRGRVVDRRSR